MKKVIWIADVFAEEYAGGAEIVNDVVIDGLIELGWEVETINSKDATVDTVMSNLENKFVLAHFLQLSQDVYTALVEHADYILYEHDHKYVKTRDPSHFVNYAAPSDMIVNTPIYRRAKAVICQSEMHAKVVRDNLVLDNVVNMKCSLWSEKEINLLKKHSATKKNGKAMVLGSGNRIKGTPEAIEWCNHNNVDYDMVPECSYEELIETMAKYDKLVFFPQTLESFNRFIVEARALNCQLVTNDNNGATHEEWFPSLKGDDLIQYMEAHRSIAVSQISRILETGESDWSIEPRELPKVSLVTSMFKGEKHIRAFLEDITAQTVFDKCELIIINANSPENEDPIIEEYMKKYDNIIYKKLDYDPGIYGVWNMGIELASNELVSNANLDDRRSPQHVEYHAMELAKYPNIDLAYSEAYVTGTDHENFYENSSQGRVYPISDFSKQAMIKCLPGCMPVWRKSMHESAGLFESAYRYAGDWEMWLRAVREGSTFKRIPGVYGMYYMNPDGLSTSAANEEVRFKEEKQIFWEYADVFGPYVVDAYSPYFSGQQR